MPQGDTSFLKFFDQEPETAGKTPPNQTGPVSVYPGSDVKLSYSRTISFFSADSSPAMVKGYISNIL